MNTTVPPASYSTSDASMSMQRANLLALLLLPALAVLTLPPFVLRWGWSPLRAGFGQVFELWFFIPAFVICIVVHEALHLVGFGVFGHVPRGSLHVGVHRASLTPFAGCRAPMRASAYRAAVLLPALVLGVVPLALGVILGYGAAAAWGWVMLAAAGGDFLVLWAVRMVPGHARVLDHPERVGCQVLREEEAAPLG